MKHLSFRTRLFVILTAFALAPAAVLTAAIGITAWRAIPELSAEQAWERVAGTGRGAIESLRDASLTTNQRDAVDSHARELETSVTQARRLQFVAARSATVLLAAALLALGVLWLAASRVAGHLSRQLSRPIDELVGWTAMIEQGSRLPAAVSRGAPEFGVLRTRMRSMAAELESSRSRMREAERSIAFRETARRVAHELKNPLTPIQLVVAQIRRDAPPGLAEAVKVLEEEAARLDRMARSFAQFGRLPEGPVSRINVGELAAGVVQSVVPPTVDLALDVDPSTPEIDGRYDALHRALINVVLNAVDAVGPEGRVRVKVARATLHGKPAASIDVTDAGPGIAADRVSQVWEPYVTDKVGGTGLGLAIARQTIAAHHGDVAIESLLGQGTTVRFVLPAASTP